MSKIMKRTLSIALVICMMLSVIPMASADDTADSYLYAFGTERVLLSTGEESGDFTAVKNTLGTGTVSGGKFSFNPTNNSHWIALSFVAKETAEYDITLRFISSQPVGQVAIFEYDEDAADAISKTGACEASAKTALNTFLESAPVNAEVNYKCNPNRVGWDSGAAYLGKMSMVENATYILFMRACAGFVSSANYQNIHQLYLTKTTAETSDFIAQTNLDPTTGDSKDKIGGFGQLCAPYTFNGTIALADKATLDLQGFELTADGLATSGTGMVKDTSEGATGSLKLTTAPVLASTTTKVAVKTAENTYEMFDLPKTTVKAGPVATDGTDADYAAGSDARFVFKATLDAEALAAIAAGTQEVTIGANWKQGDKDLAATIFENEDVITWATGDNSTAKVFYIDVKGMDRLASGETVTCTPYITIGSVTKTLAPITYTAA